MNGARTLRLIYVRFAPKDSAHGVAIRKTAQASATFAGFQSDSAACSLAKVSRTSRIAFLSAPPSVMSSRYVLPT